MTEGPGTIRKCKGLAKKNRQLLVQATMTGKPETDEAITQIRATLDGSVPTALAQPVAPKPHTMSPTARKRMALMMKRRWAKAKKAGKKSLK